LKYQKPVRVKLFQPCEEPGSKAGQLIWNRLTKEARIHPIFFYFFNMKHSIKF